MAEPDLLSMSRPQFNQPGCPNAQFSQGVVNGGLIDFQDNAHRGVAEGLPSAVSQAYPGGPYVSCANGGFLPGAAMPATLQGFNGGLGTGTVGGSCFSGPPTFLHVNGITYRPVSESMVGSDQGVAQQSIDPAACGSVSVASTPPTQVVTEDELGDMIKDRVQTQVDAYLRSHRSRSHSKSPNEPRAVPAQSQPRAVSSGGGKAVSSGRTLTREEALAIQRVHTANASIKHVVAASPVVNGRRSNW